MSTHSFRLGPLEVRVARDPGGPLTAVVRHGDDTLWLAMHGPAPLLGAGFQLSPSAGEDPLRLHVHGGLFRLYAALHSARAARVASRVCAGHELETSLDMGIVDGGDGPEVMVSGSWFADLWSGKPSDPRFAVGLRGLLLGELETTVHRGPEETRELELPEGTYTLRATPSRRELKRARWPWAQTVPFVHAVVVDGPDGRLSIPIPVDKDDRDEESIASIALAAADVDAAMTELRALVERKRLRHGGPGWVPTDRQPETMSAQDFLDCASGTIE